MMKTALENLVVMVVAACLLCHAAAFADDGRLISNPASPEVRMTARDGVATFTVAAMPGTTASGRLIAARAKAKSVDFAGFPARADLSERALGAGPLRLWMRVEWKDAKGAIRQGETFFTPSLGAVPPPSVAAMRVFDLAGFEASLADEALRIRIPFEMSADGKASLVVDDPATGRRIRNLVSGKAFSKGRHEVEWDGRREDGTQVPPGDYAVRIVEHPGLSYDVLARFANGGERRWNPYGPTHTCFRSMCSNGEKIQASANFTEGGQSTVVMDLDGRMRQGWGEIWTLGNKALFHVSGSNQFYSVREMRKQEKDADGVEKERSKLQIFAYDWNDGNRMNVFVRGMPGSNSGFRDANASSLGDCAALTGAVKIGEKVYVGDRLQDGVVVYRLVEGERSTEFSPTDEKYPLADVGCLAADGESAYVCDGTEVKRIDPVSPGRIEKVCVLPVKPTYAAVHQGRLYALQDGEHRIFVYDLKTGRLVRTLGEPGGDYAGPWRKNRLVDPLSLFFAPDGSLWVTENRQSPKRLTRWDVDKGEVVYEKLGSESYGSPGCGLDPDDPTHWLAQDAEWRIDPATGRDEVIGSLMVDSRLGDGRWNAPPTRNRFYKFEKRDGRTFVIGNGPASTIYELKNHRLVPLALISTPGIYSFQLGRSRTCEPLVEAYTNAFANELSDPRRRFPPAKVNESVPMLWLDRNGNELLDADEISFGPADSDGVVGYWGYALSGLDFSIQVTTDSGMKVLSFSPLGWSKKGVPLYSMEEAWKRAATVSDELPVGASPPRHTTGFSDSHGRSISVATEPYLLAFDAQGELDWYFRNPFPGVDGSQKAPLPIPGELQGLLFGMGIAPFSKTADVTAIMNNHGRVFFMTTDGILLDELFNDCRVASTADASLIGGEPFGGSFQYDDVNHRYVLQAGGGGCRVYEIDGLDKVREQRTKISVTAQMLQAAARLNPVVKPEARVVPELRIPRSAKKTQDWRIPRLAEWASGNWRIELDGEYDAENLYLSYTVWEPSPWVNNGSDRFLMFKTGDCVDFQLATNPAKGGSRPSGGLGDVRVLASPLPAAPGTNQVVLYRHRIPTGEKAKARPMEFNSPIRKYPVDDVQTPSDAVASVSVESRRYIVRLTIPLKVLGLDAGVIVGQTFKGDFGVIFGDSDGTVDLSRVYWANKETGLVSDVPGEMMPEPDKWGTIIFN